MKRKFSVGLGAVLALVLTVALALSAAALTDGQLIRGDANGDGAVNMKDVLLLRKYIAGMDVALAPHNCAATAAGQLVRGDVNGDGAVNMKDVLLMRKFIAGMDVEFAEHSCEVATEPTGILTTQAEPTATATQTEPTATVTQAEPSETQTVVSRSQTTASTEPAATTTTERKTTQTTEYIPNELESDPDSIDLVTLTFNDRDASVYGVSFHSRSRMHSPMVQLVEGETTDPAAFSSATEFKASTRRASTKEWDNYDVKTYEFDYDWGRRGSMTTAVDTFIHQAELTGLSYNTTYSYRVGNKLTDTWSPIYTFTTRPETVGDFSFIFTADTQPDLGDKKAYVGMNMLFNKAFSVTPNPAFLLSGGDFIYCSEEGQGGISQWRNVINGCNNLNVDETETVGAAGSLFAEHPWMVANGNHDNNVVQNFFHNTTTANNKDYYSFDYGNTHFTVLDSGLEGSLDSNQLSWLQNDLSSAAGQKFKMVFLHWPFYCHVQRDLKGSHRDALPIFDQYGVDFVVSGHVNTDYYTTYPVKDGAVATKECVVEGDVQYFAGGNGTIYLQNAASGLSSDGKEAGRTGALYANSTSYPSLMIHPIRAGIESSFMVVDVTSDKLTLNRYYLDKNLDVKRYDVGQVGVVR